mmetsp:Transcript_68497/g.121623  ORF Transcript_68497/g.121623 Transcript_68497/m.121623 type:complete len:405 (+) Transcript_68497:70-1284(+)
MVASQEAGWNIEGMEKDLLSMLRDGILCDLVEVEDERNFKSPKAIDLWRHLPIKLYESPTATRFINMALDQSCPGTGATYNDILSAIMHQTHVDGFCYIMGGQVRDMLTGKISRDVDINFACTAKDVAALCVENEWPVKYKEIGCPGGKPNYVLIGDDQSGLYMEGFSISFNNSTELHRQDFRQNMFFYDLTNNVIIDKTGYGVIDLRNNELRISSAPAKNFEEWVANDVTQGEKALRYVKFLVRSNVRNKPKKIDEDECAFVVSNLKKAFRENAASLRGYWFGYLLGEFLRSQEGLQALHKWVCDQSGQTWWDDDWLPFVQPLVADPSWLILLTSEASTVKLKLETLDDAGDGSIHEEHLKEILRRLNADFTDKDFEMLFDGVRSSSPEQLNFNEFVDFVFGA